MGDLRYEKPYRRVSDASDPAAEIQHLHDEEVIAALAASVTESNAYLSNVLATEAMNRVRRARTIMDHLGEGVFAVDLQGRLTFLNPTAEKILGWRGDEILGTRFHDLVHRHMEEGSQAVPWETCPVRLAMETGEVHVRRNHGDAFARKDGSLFPVAMTAAPIRREDEVVGGACVFRDITEEHEAEQALRESEERFRALADAASEAILIHQGGRTLEVNGAFTRMTGYEAPEAIGRSVLDFVAPDDRAQAREVIAKRPETAYQLRALRKDGSTFRAEIRGRNVSYRGKPARVIAVREIQEDR